LQAMGVGADWSRVMFTLDASVCKAVTRLFVQLHK
jgi:valyl-tRNA synthetase